ncbi:MAG: PP2C family protein-serine/threonine phosphatase [Thermoanaerobaculia bacterium]
MTATRARQVIRDARSFVERYTEGVQVDHLRHLFDREASTVYEVLSRDIEGAEPEGRNQRFFHRLKVVFLGLSYKLSPPRRILFAACLAIAVFGLLDVNQLQLGVGTRDIAIDFSPLFFLSSICGLVYLLAMELVDRVRFRDELEVARQLQRDLLPDAAPAVHGFSFAHSYRTANTIGGDYFDFLPTGDGRLAVLVGDASGHGIAAGLLMAIANASLRTALDLDPQPEAVLSFLNRVLCRTGDRRAFMTLFYCLLDPTTERVDYACAGHPFPLLRTATGEVREVDTEGSLPLGMRTDTAVRTGSFTFAPGDTLALFTDGLPEAVGTDNAAFGFPRLQSLLAAPGTPQSLHDRILAAFDHRQSDRPLADDLTLLLLARDQG